MKIDDAVLYDVRNIDRNIQMGLLTHEDYLRHLKTLPDVASKAEPMRDPDGKKP
mgnify:CR=1 FL=1